MHIVEVFPDRWKCSCGSFEESPTGGAQASRRGFHHSDVNRPSIFIDRRLCSKECLEGLRTRDIKISLHDENCPQGERNNNG